MTKTRPWVMVAIVALPLAALLLGLVIVRTPVVQAEFERQKARQVSQEAQRAETRQRQLEQREEREAEAAAQREQERITREASERAAWAANGLGPAYEMINDDWRTLQEWHDADAGNRNAVIHYRLERMIMNGHVRRERANKGAMYECMRALDQPRNRPSTIADVMYACAERNSWLTTPSGRL